jgi:hypothetical protein
MIPDVPDLIFQIHLAVRRMRSLDLGQSDSVWRDSLGNSCRIAVTVLTGRLIMKTMPAQIIHLSIERHWRDVYAFAANPENVARWASGLADGLTRDGDEWVANGGPIGRIKVRFAPGNDFGVIDHVVVLDSGIEVLNALRVLPNGQGAEVMFTLLRQPGIDDASFAADAAQVLEDLKTLKALMESDHTQ